MAGPARAQLEQSALPDGVRLVAARGELDVAAAPALRACLDAALAEAESGLLVDLTEVDFVDSVCLAALVRAHRRLHGRLALVATHQYVLLVLEAGGLDGVLNVFDGPERAMAFLSP